MEKDEAMVALLDKLDLERRGWCVQDHWPADLCAIGLVSESMPNHLVYVSTFGMPADRFHCQCEVADDTTDSGYRVVIEKDNLSLAELEDVLVRHLT